MKHQPNMRGSKGDQSEFHRLPNLSAIFSIPSISRPHYGNGRIETYATPTSTNAHCRPNSVRSVSPSTHSSRLTVTRGDKAQSPNSSRKVNRIHLGKALIAAPATDRQSPFHQLVRPVSRVRQGDGILFSSSHRSRPALLNDTLQDLEAEAKALAARIAAKKARLK